MITKLREKELVKQIKIYTKERQEIPNTYTSEELAFCIEYIRTKYKMKLTKYLNDLKKYYG